MNRFAKHPYSVSQNFTTSPFILNKLKEVLPKTAHTVLDIGAGKGAITSLLADTYDSVIAIEPDLSLHNPFKHNAAVMWLQKEFSPSVLPRTPFDVVSNIPFSKTAQILTLLLRTPEFTSGVLILQKEAAEKFAGQQLQARQTYQSARTQNEFTVEKILTCKPTDFTPIPKVPIIIISIRRRITPVVAQTNQFYDFLAFTFNKSVPIVQKAFPAAQLGTLGVRVVSTLSFDDLITLYSLTQQWAKMYQGYELKLNQEAKSIQKVFRTRRDKNWKEHAR